MDKDYTYREADITAISGNEEELLKRNEWKSYMENGQISSVQVIQSVSVRTNDLIFRFREKQMIRTFQTETIMGFVPEYSTFSQAKVNYLQSKIENFDKMVAGREFQAGDRSSVILSERTAFELGFLNPNEIIGQKLEIDLGEEVLEVRIIGVAAAQLCGENEIMEFERQQLSDLKMNENEVYSSGTKYNETEEAAFAMKGFFSADVVEKVENNRADAEEIRTIIHISIAKVKDTLSVIQNLNQLLGNAFFLTGNLLSLFSAMETIKKGTNIMFLLSLILALLTLLNLYCVLYMVSDKQKKSFALKNILGYSKKTICNMYSMEICIATGIAAFFSFVLGFFVCKVADMVIINAYKSRIHIQSGLITFPIMFFVFFAVFFFATGWCIAYRRTSVILKEPSIEILEK